MLFQKRWLTLFDPEKFINLSKVIYSQVVDQNDVIKDEEWIRTAIGRAYYGIFHLTKIHLEEKHKLLFSDNKDVHREVINAVSNHISKPVSDSLDFLRTLRNGADYNLQISYMSNIAERAINCADSIKSHIT